MRAFIILAMLFGFSGYVSAQSTTATKTAPPPASVQIGPATVAPSATTTYTMPGKGPDGGPIPGNQRGSSASTSVGVTATIPYGK